ncbi:bestrophin family ion channel [Bordetella sp. FB-8]|uniref:bestrophin family ion channel n=1 Tax=Bordetella sp. FB-8 TaxID=1159870 RepID=UPI001E3A622D|nr:bestrophin family ion channel [Bordetella sp. FB-8]
MSDIVYQGLLQRVAACAAVQAACERIHNTPAPFAYSLLLHRTAWLFCLLLRSIVRTIEIDLLDGLGVRPLPQPLSPSNYVLR